jgi:hypothetical protein
MEELPTISVNIDKKCTRCNKKGAAQNGLCMKCIIKAVGKGEYDHILKKPYGCRPAERDATSEALD